MVADPTHRRRFIVVGLLLLCALFTSRSPAAAQGVQAVLAEKTIFTSMLPCRVIDTRLAPAGPLVAGLPRTFDIVGETKDYSAQGGSATGCGIPGFEGIAQVQAVVFNFVAVVSDGTGNLRAWATDQPMPLASILYYRRRVDTANAITVAVRQDMEGGDLTVQADGSATHLVVDAAGFYRKLTLVDGPNSEIDADLLDGMEAAAFAAADHTHPSAGDITEVIAGTGLAGGGTSGAVTLELATPLPLSGSSSGAVLSVTNSGTGPAISAAGAINTSTQYNIGGKRVLSTAGNSNTFAGVDAGLSNTTGSANSFFGRVAGSRNTTVSSNAFFGDGAGFSNTTGSSNAFFGISAGQNNTASFNSFFGHTAGLSNTMGNNNAFFGASAGFSNTTGNDNAFFGRYAGENNTASGNSFFGASAGRFNMTGAGNAFFGSFAGENNTASGNAFFGASAGLSNTTGSGNAFFGSFAGHDNTASGNSFFGASAGADNTSGFSNAFFGTQAGLNNLTGSNNAFFGFTAGLSNTTGGANSFFGREAGKSNTGGSTNSFFGMVAGFSNTLGTGNAFFGTSAGFSNTTGSNNTIIGTSAAVSTGNLTNATAIGHRAQVSQSNSLVLGSINGVNSATAGTNVGIGTTVPNTRLDVVDPATQIRFGPSTAENGGFLISTGPSQAIIAGGARWSGSEWIARSSATSQLYQANGLIRFFSDSGLIAGSTFSPTERLRITAGGDLAFINGATERARIRTDSNGNLVIATINGAAKDLHFRAGDDSATDMVIKATGGGVGIGTANPQALLHVAGVVKVDEMGTAGNMPICLNGFSHLALCGSSIRYKEQVRPFLSGLDLLRRLQAVTFNWKTGGKQDIGLVAEDVEKVEPLLVIYSADGQVEGVKYDRISVVLMNAIREQQEQIEQQQKLIEALQRQNATLLTRITAMEHGMLGGAAHK